MSRYSKLDLWIAEHIFKLDVHQEKCDICEATPVELYDWETYTECRCSQLDIQKVKNYSSYLPDAMKIVELLAIYQLISEYDSEKKDFKYGATFAENPKEEDWVYSYTSLPDVICKAAYKIIMDKDYE